MVQVTPQVAPGETRKVINIQYKMLIGADGAGSVVRRCLEDQVDGMEFETGNEQ